MILVALAGQSTASGLSVPSTSTVTTDPLSTTTTTVTDPVGTVTNAVDSTTGTLPTTTTPLPTGTTTTSPTTTVNNTTTTVTDTTKTATKPITTTLDKTTSTTSSPTVQNSPTSTGTTQTLSSPIQYLTGSTGSGTSGGGTSGSGYTSGGTSGSGPSGPGVSGSGGGTTGASGSGPPGMSPLYSIQVSKARSILDYLARGSRIGGPGRGAAIVQLQDALSLLQGCFYGLSGRERRVLNMRAGLGGRFSHSRSYVARRLDISRARVRGIEQSALLTLEGLANTTGCANGPGAAAAAAVADGYISPAELGQAPQLVTLADPAFQGAGQSQFSRLGTVPEFRPGLPATRFGGDSGSGTFWALQLLAVMLALGLAGLYRGAPALVAWLHLKREGIPASTVSVRSTEPAPRPVHRHGESNPPVPEGARPKQREIPS
jgi:hypothetical protein